MCSQLLYTVPLESWEANHDAGGAYCHTVLYNVMLRNLAEPLQKNSISAHTVLVGFLRGEKKHLLGCLG